MKKHPMLLSALIANILPALVFLIVFLILFFRISVPYDMLVVFFQFGILLLIFSILNGIFSTWLFRSISHIPLTLGQGMRVGALCGLITPVLNAYLFILIISIMSHSWDDYMAFFAGETYLLFILPLSIILGLVSGLIGGSIFRRRKALNSTGVSEMTQ